MAGIKKGFESFRGRSGNLLENLFIVILVFYPLRHIMLGLDLWDTGYSYGNFRYMGTQQMGSMWFFSTYLTNVVGNFLMKLPNADTLMGINLYTGLFASAMALIGYFFCTRKLKIPRGIAFVGEMTALSLCWCPTATFYNYLTYLVFLVASIFLYLGLTKERKEYLVCAGVCLGANVLVRFPNLSEAAMIVAVWAYDLIVWMEGRRIERQRKPIKMTDVSYSESSMTGGSTDMSDRENGVSGGKSDMSNNQKHMSGSRKAVSCSSNQRLLSRVLRHTLWCLLGYAVSLALLLLWIHQNYGITEYAKAIGSLFAMTENASSYKPTSMVNGIVGAYVEHLYWVIRMAVVVLGGMAVFAAAGWLEELFSKETLSHKEELSHKERSRRMGNVEKNSFAKYLFIGVRILWAAVCAVMVVWLYKRNFFSFLFYSYDPIMRSGIVFLMLTMFIAIVRIFHRGSPKEEKLISGMLILIILLTPLGSNNGILPSLNNLFLAAPYTLWECWRFLRYVGDRKISIGKKGKWDIILSSFPAKAFLAVFIALCLFLFGAFGWRFAFAEATGIQDATETVDNIPVLKNIKMSPQKAQWMTELSSYIDENSLQGQEVILYGYIPALSYYLQMPAAITTWSDLDSYRYEVMEEDVARLKEIIAAGGKEKPVIILENAYALYAEGGHTAMEAAGLSDAAVQKVEEDPKWQLWMEFLEAFGYEQTFRNEKFALYR